MQEKKFWKCHGDDVMHQYAYVFIMIPMLGYDSFDFKIILIDRTFDIF